MADRLNWTLNKKTKTPQEIRNILGAGENAEQTYLMQNGYVCLTNQRIAVIEKSGAAASRTAVYSFPYRSIDYWVAADTETLISVYSELTVWLTNVSVKLTVNKNCDIDEISRTIAYYRLK